MWGLCFTRWCLRTPSLGKPILPLPPPYLLLVSKSANTSSICTNSLWSPRIQIVLLFSWSLKALPPTPYPEAYSKVGSYMLLTLSLALPLQFPLQLFVPSLESILERHASVPTKSPYPSLVTDPSLQPWLRLAHEETLPHQPLGFLTPIYSQPLPCPSSSNDEAH